MTHLGLTLLPRRNCICLSLERVWAQDRQTRTSCKEVRSLHLLACDLAFSGSFNLAYVDWSRLQYAVCRNLTSLDVFYANAAQAGPRLWHEKTFVLGSKLIWAKDGQVLTSHSKIHLTQPGLPSNLWFTHQQVYAPRYDNTQSGKQRGTKTRLLLRII
jgi:hypothetical protein